MVKIFHAVNTRASHGFVYQHTPTHSSSQCVSRRDCREIDSEIVEYFHSSLCKSPPRRKRLLPLATASPTLTGWRYSVLGNRFAVTRIASGLMEFRRVIELHGISPRCFTMRTCALSIMLKLVFVVLRRDIGYTRSAYGTSRKSGGFIDWR